MTIEQEIQVTKKLTEISTLASDIERILIDAGLNKREDPIFDELNQIWIFAERVDENLEEMDLRGEIK